MKITGAKNKFLSLSLICFTSLFANLSFASEFEDLDFTTASVVSGSAQVSESTASAVDASKPENIVIYGGYVYNGTANQGKCLTPTSNSVCDSCDGAITDICTTTVYACATRSIHPDLRLEITMALNALPSATPTIRAEMAVSGGTASSVPVDSDSIAPTAANQSFTVYIKWRNICTALGIDNCTTLASFGSKIGEMSVGLIDGSATSLAAGNFQKFTVKLRVVNPSTSSIITPTTTPTDSQGFSDFSVLPGDQKAYIRELWRGSTGPDSAVATRWKSLRVFFAKDVNNTHNFCSINPSVDGYADLDVTDRNTKATSLGQEFLDGLENEQAYMFTGASVDEATIVSDFIDVSTSSTAVQNQYMATPGEVIGLLDKQKCFVATAAFGSPMNDHVVNLRKFRDQVLVNNSWGKNFVRFYYRNSTKWAHFIDQHEILKPIVRGLLWPFVVFAELSLVIGLLATSLMYLAGFAVAAYFIFRTRSAKETAK